MISKKHQSHVTQLQTSKTISENRRGRRFIFRGLKAKVGKVQNAKAISELQIGRKYESDLRYGRKSKMNN